MLIPFPPVFDFAYLYLPFLFLLSCVIIGFKVPIIESHCSILDSEVSVIINTFLFNICLSNLHNCRKLDSVKPVYSSSVCK